MSTETPPSITALVIAADPAAPIRTVSVRDSLDALRFYVGGGQADEFPYRPTSSLEAVGLGDGGSMYMDEDGKAKGLPVNRRATVMGWMHGLPSDDRIVGDVIVVGLADEDGNDTSVPDDLAEWVEHVGRLAS